MTLGAAKFVKHLGVATLIGGLLGSWVSLAADFWFPQWLELAAGTTLTLWILTAVLDIILVLDARPTITSWMRAALPRWADYTLLILEGGIIWWVFGLVPFFGYLYGVVRGHTSWNE